MKTSNPFLLNEIDVLEEISRKDSSELEVVKRIDELEKQVETMAMIIRTLVVEKQSVRNAKKYLIDNGLQGNPLR
jgi:hypothetical protein